MRCDKHRKDHIGGCQWCGKRLCQLCIAKAEGKKIYCDKCAGILSPLKRERLPVMKESPGIISGMKPRFVVKDGYLVMEGSE